MNTKNMHMSPNKCSKFLLLSLKSFVAKEETLGYAKVIHKKELRKKWTSVQDIEKQWVLRCLPEKKRDE